MRVFVDRRHIAHQPPFHVETFKTGFAIDCDAGGLNCVRFADAPLAIGDWGARGRALLERACEALNAEPIGDVIEAEVEA